MILSGLYIEISTAFGNWDDVVVEPLSHENVANEDFLTFSEVLQHKNNTLITVVKELTLNH